MQRRRNKADDHDGSHPLPLTTATPRRRKTTPPPTSSNFGFVVLLVVLFSALMAVEFIAYRMLGATSSQSSSNSADSSAIKPSGGDGRRATSPKESHSVRTNRPTPKPVAPSPQHTFEPTNGQMGWRVKEARLTSHKNSEFWKSYIPDPLPPLPPDVDPTTGEELPPVIAYVTTLTKCGPKHRGGLDGAAVLLHSIRRNSYGWVPMEDQIRDSENAQHMDENVDRPLYGGRGGKYRYRAYVIVDPAASPQNEGRSGECARFLQKIGYVVLHRPPLVPLFEVPDLDEDGHEEEGSQGIYHELKNEGFVAMDRPLDGPTAVRKGEHPDKLRKFMHNDGCCGYTELLKLHVYGMVEHALAVHLDFDSLLLRPMDDLFDAMLAEEDGDGEEARKKLPMAKLPRTREVDYSKRIDAAFVRDYNSVNHPSLDAPVGYQGGFLVVRPDLDVLERYRTILRRGEFLLGPRDGWAGKFGGFYGDVTFQGILPYYYESVAPQGVHNEAELDRCIFNQMGDNPRKSTYKFPRATPLDEKKMGFHDTKQCRDGRTDCSDTDCQRIHPKDSVTTHFTFCKKPWDCSQGNPGTVVAPTCLGLLKEWYGIRRELEDWWLLPSPRNNNEIETNSKNNDILLNNQQSFYWKEGTISKVKQSRVGDLDNAQYFGYCDKYETGGYHRLVEPDGPKSR
mmetsp:Transcript_15583/g.32911  ORF Transcript_15583/g.32911 Transcript_15583/m.32911 type:complete len:678 (+) Transcript_15583:67-2100(+)